jgi:pseudouridine-5'-phosphate glycosidase
MGYLEDVTTSGLSEREKEALVSALFALKSVEGHESVDISDINVVDLLQEKLLLLDMVVSSCSIISILKYMSENEIWCGSKGLPIFTFEENNCSIFFQKPTPFHSAYTLQMHG